MINYKTKVFTLGVFHFNFPNLDSIEIKESDKIDVLENKFQEEIKLIVDKIVKFKPTIIAVERFLEDQEKTNRDYIQFLNNNYDLTREESEQIGFRVAKQMNLKKYIV